MKKMKKLFVALTVLVLCLSVAVPASAAVKISAKNMTLTKGQSKNLKITGTKSKAKWSSNKKSVATVTSKGKVTAKKNGTATITAKVGKKKYTCKVKVETPKISKAELSLVKGKTATLKVSGTSQKVTWKSSNKKIATVTSKGKVKGVKAGSCKITATVGGKKYSCKVTVKVKDAGFSAVEAEKKITYQTYDIGHSFIFLAKNNYNYSIRLSIEMLYYNTSNKVIDVDWLNEGVIEPGKEFPFVMNKPRIDERDGGSPLLNYHKYAVKWHVFDAPEQAFQEDIRYTSHFGNNNLIVEITNTSNRTIYAQDIVALYYKNGILQEYSFRNVGVLSPKGTNYCEMDLPRDDNFNVVYPDFYKIYIC